jgi:hypothetical protein
MIEAMDGSPYCGKHQVRGRTRPAVNAKHGFMVAKKAAAKRAPAKKAAAKRAPKKP